MFMMVTRQDTREEMKQSAKLEDSSGGPTCIYGSKTTFEDVQRVSRGRFSHIELELRCTRSLPPSEPYHSKPSQWTSSSVYHQMVPWTQSSPSWTMVALAPPCSSHAPPQLQAQRWPSFTSTTSTSGSDYRTG